MRVALRVHNYTNNNPQNHEIIQGWRKTVESLVEAVHLENTLDSSISHQKH